MNEGMVLSFSVPEKERQKTKRRKRKKEKIILLDNGCYSEKFINRTPFSNFKAYIMITKFKEIWEKPLILFKISMVLTTALITAISTVVYQVIEIDHK